MLEDKAKAVSSRVGSLPWDMILEFLMQLMEDCFPTSESLRDAKSMGPFRKLALGVRIRSHFGMRGRRRVNEMRTVLLDELARTDDNALNQMWLEAKRELHPSEYGE